MKIDRENYRGGNKTSQKMYEKKKICREYYLWKWLKTKEKLTC